ncbi:UNVERIFIED_ORG: putative phage-associated protein [Xanthomonas campestris]
MSYSPALIANYFLSKAKAESRAVTPMQLLKLVYIAHGYFLGYFKKPLLNEEVQAWKYGPVIYSLYNELKHYGNRAVAELVPTGPFPWNREKEVDPAVASLLDRVWQVYAKYSGVELSTLTHQPGTPWDIEWNHKGGRSRYFAEIDNSIIQDHYEKIIMKGHQAA